MTDEHSPTPPEQTDEPDEKTPPPFDKDVPPDLSKLSQNLSPSQIAHVLGMTTDNARTRGNRGEFGQKIKRGGRTYYAASAVLSVWERLYAAPPALPSPIRNEPIRTANSPKQAALFAPEQLIELFALLRQDAENRVGADETINRLSHVIERQSDELERKTAEIDALKKQLEERPKEANEPDKKSFWRRLFGG